MSLVRIATWLIPSTSMRPSWQMITEPQIRAVAAAYGLGDDASATGASARGEMGEVAQVRSSRGEFAVERVFVPVAEEDVVEEVAFIAAVRRVGVLAPLPVLTSTREVLLTV